LSAEMALEHMGDIVMEIRKRLDDMKGYPKSYIAAGPHHL